jgi:hypothetical protein
MHCVLANVIEQETEGRIELTEGSDGKMRIKDVNRYEMT